MAPRFSKAGREFIDHLAAANEGANPGLPRLALKLATLAFVALVMLGNLIMGSASAKYAFLAPVFVPMFMQVGISPELTQAAYRVGDSATNVITPLVSVDPG